MMWLSALLFVAFVGTVIMTGVGTVMFAAMKRARMARLSGGIGGSAIVVYAVLLVVTGATSQGRELAKGAEKHICEIDCHLAYSVIDARRGRDTYQVTMRVRFDEGTIGPRRGDVPVYPGRRRIVLIDEDGATYEPTRTVRLEQPLRPGESIHAILEFPLPRAPAVKLRFEDADPSKRLLIGSETAPLHKRTTFRLT